MCGIAGFLGTRPVPREDLTRCLGLMGRRGPDAQRILEHRVGERVCYLLNSRLAILDLDSRADLPYSCADRDLAFNGELYNFLEIRAELEKRGYRFETSSDTEVFHAALVEWGPAALERFEGMWAFAHYDRRDGSLLLGRDRFGEKPLYLLRRPEGLYFGSEPKFVFALAGRRGTPDREQVVRYLVQGYKALYKRDRTFFEDLRELPRASLARIGPDGAESAWSYWSPRFEAEAGMTREEAVAGTRSRLIRSLGIRLRADVPLAFCMSGGVDSNSLISIARRVFGYDVHGFTITNTDARYEENELVERAVRELGIRHVALPLERRHFLDDLRELVAYHDAPVYTVTYHVHWLLMGKIRERGYKISVSGTAADELFTGYYDHHNLFLHEMRADPEYPRHLAGWNEKVRPWVRNPFLADPELYRKDPGFRDHVYSDAQKFRTFLARDWWEPFTEEAYTGSLLRNRMLNELFHEATPAILHEDDLNAMYHSVENRSPYLDRELFEFSSRIPTRHLVKDGLAKSVLRDAMRGIVPDPILDNPRKVGFNAPVDDLIDRADPGTRAWLLEDSPIFDLVDRGRIGSFLQKPRLDDAENKFLFYFLSARLFLERFS